MESASMVFSGSRLRNALFLPLAALIGLAPQGWAEGLALPETVHDFGSIPPGRKVSHRFAVRNGGPLPLNILRLVPSCGCTTASGAPLTLPPGGEAFLTVTIDPLGFQGGIRKTVQVITDRPGEDPGLLSLAAEVVPRVVASANRVVFDEVARDGGGRAELRLESRNGQPVELEALATPPYLSLQTRRLGLSLVLELTFDGAKVPPDRWRGSDTLNLVTRHEEAGPIPIQVLWTMEQPRK